MFSPAECPDSHSSGENTNKLMPYTDKDCSQCFVYTYCVSVWGLNALYLVAAFWQRQQSKLGWKSNLFLCLGNVIHSTCASVHTHKTYLFYHIQDCLFEDVCPKEHFFFLPDLADREVSQRYWSLRDAVFSRFPSLRLPACSRSSVSAEHLCWSHVVHLAEYLDSRCQAKVHFCFWWYVLQTSTF